MKILGYILLFPLVWIFFVAIVAIIFPKTKEDGKEGELALLALIYTLGLYGALILIST